jgi:hypothetical protein
MVGGLLAVVLVKNLPANGADYVTRPGFSNFRSVIRAAVLQTPPVSVAHFLHANFLNALPPHFRTDFRYQDVRVRQLRSVYEFEHSP